MGTSNQEEDSLLRDLARAPDVGPSRMPRIAVSSDGISVTSRPPVLAIGQVLGGRFEVVAQIGKGGMGEVYRARDRQLGRSVAVKVLAVADHERKRRFAQEARAASALQHPNILTVFDVSEHDDAPYLVLELLEGETLRERLAHGATPPATALDYAIQIANGLAAAHAAGIVHRDLKPENLLIARDPSTHADRLKILDFGLAKLTRDRDAVSPASSLTVTGAILGTVSYMSPEQLRGEDVDHRSDVFAFGTIVIEMLTGKAPFGAGSSADIVTAILRDEVALGSLPAGFERVIRRCLEKRPERRFQSTQDLVFALESLRSVPMRPRVRIPSTVWFALGILAIVAAGIAVYTATRTTETETETVVAPSARAQEPVMTRLTYRRGAIQAARFGPDGKTVYYSARWPYSQPHVETTRAGIFESRMIDVGIGELLAVSRDGDLLVQTGIDRRSVWQMWSLGKLARASLGGGTPREALDSISEADFAPDGTLAVVHVVGTKWRLEWPAGTVLAETTGWFGEPRVSRDGTRIAFIDHGYPEDDGGAVVVIDKTGKRTILARDLLSVMGLAWSANGREVWFTGTRHGASRELRAVDLEGHERLLLRAPGALRLFDVSATGEVLVDRVDYRARTAMHWKDRGERDLSWLDGTAVNDCIGGTLLFSESWDGAGTQYGLYTRSLDGGPATRIGDGLGGAMSADFKWMSLFRVTANGGRDAFVLPVGPGEPKKIAAGAWGGSEWFPDGKRILLVDTDGVTVVHDLATGVQKSAFPSHLTNTFGIALSPDGAVVAAQGVDHQLSLFEVGGTTVTPIFGLPPHALPLRFNADGSHLIVCQHRPRRAPLPPRSPGTRGTTPLKKWRRIDGVRIIHRAMERVRAQVAT